MISPSVNLNQLITFYFVAKCQSITQAADQLYITQPAVSMQIKALEAYLGVKLHHFKNRKVYLTEHGQQLLEKVENLYRATMEIEQLFGLASASGAFSIGMAGSIAMHFFPLVEKFKELHHPLRVAVRDGPSLRIIGEILDFKLDVGIVARLEEVPKELLVHRVVNRERMVLVSQPGRFAGFKRELTWSDLEGQPLIVHCEGSVVRKNVLAGFANRGVTPTIAAEVDNIEYMKRLVQQGVGSAFMFFPNVRSEAALNLLEVVPFSFGEVCLGVDVVMRKEQETNPLCEDFLTLITQQLEMESI